MAIDKEFNDVQLFINFLKDVQGDAKLAASILYSNLDPSGNTNIAIEFAKIYSWYTKMVEYVPPAPGDSGDGTFKIKEDAIPDSIKDATTEGHYDPTTGKFINEHGQEVTGESKTIYVDTINNTIYRYDSTSGEFKSIDQDTKYTFREGNVSGAFEVSEDGGAYQSITIHNVATLTDGKIDSTQLPDSAKAKYRIITGDKPDKFTLQVSFDNGATWTNESNITLGLLATTGTSPDEVGKIKSSLLPSYVDDVIEGYYYNGKFYTTSAHTTQITPQVGKIYVDVSTGTDTSNHSFRYSGSNYIDISNPLDADTIISLLGNFQGSTSTTAGKTGLVPAPSAGNQNNFLKGDATWGDPVEDFRGSVNDGTNTLILHCTNRST